MADIDLSIKFKTEKQKEIEDITLPEIAEHFHISKGQLCRFFKKMTNMPPIDYLNYSRINKSALLLRNTDLSVIAVAGQTGFNNTSYYNRTFRRYMNMTPEGTLSGMVIKEISYSFKTII